jgi:cyclase
MLRTTYLKGLVLSFAAMAIFCLCATGVGAQRPQGPRPVTVKPLHDGVYWVEGGVGSNTGFIVGTDGVIVFDPKESVESAQQVLAEIAKITPKPVTHVIVSHSNPDHVKGLPAYKGATIVAQQNAAREIESLAFYTVHTVDSAPDWRVFVPSQIVDTRADTKIDGVNIDLLHFAPAHTSGDLIAFLPDQKIVFVGDLFGPNIHLENGGSSEGMIESLRGLVSLDADTYVRGHAPPATKAEMQKVLDDMTEKRNKIAALYAEGKSLEEAEQAMGEKVIPAPAPTPAPLKAYRPARDMNYTEIVYTELARR